MFANCKKGVTVVDCSTIDPVFSKTLHEQAEHLGLRFLDAPVSGGVTGAAAGTLSFMVGGSEETMSVRPYFVSWMVFPS